MKLSRWEKLKTDKNLRKMTHRNMLSYEKIVDNGRTVVCCPETLLKKLQELTPNPTIYDACYRMRKSRSFEYENLYIVIRLDEKVVKAKFTLNTKNDVFESAFSYRINEEENEEIKTFLMQVFQLMQAFVEENSPKRLLYLSSSVDEDFPEWIVEKEKTV